MAISSAPLKHSGIHESDQMEMILRTQAFKEALDGFHNEAVVCRSINAENFPGRASLLKLQTAISSTADIGRTVYIGNPSGNAAPHSGARTGMRKHDTYLALHYILLASAGPCPGTQLPSCCSHIAPVCSDFLQPHHLQASYSLTVFSGFSSLMICSLLQRC